MYIMPVSFREGAAVFLNFGQKKKKDPSTSSLTQIHGLDHERDQFPFLLAGLPASKMLSLVVTNNISDLPNSLFPCGRFLIS